MIYCSQMGDGEEHICPQINLQNLANKRVGEWWSDGVMEWWKWDGWVYEHIHESFSEPTYSFLCPLHGLTGLANPFSPKPTMHTSIWEGWLYPGKGLHRDLESILDITNNNTEFLDEFRNLDLLPSHSEKLCQMPLHWGYTLRRLNKGLVGLFQVGTMTLPWACHWHQHIDSWDMNSMGT